MDRPIEVTAYAGGRGDERPLTIRLGPTPVRVVRLLERWVETGQQPGEGLRRWFRVQLQDGRSLAASYDEALDGWFYREEA